MPWGHKDKDHDVSRTDKQTANTVRRINADVNAEAKRRVQQNRKATSRDGNRKSR